MWHIYVRDGERFVYHSSEDGKSARIVRNGFLARQAGTWEGRPENVRVSRTAPPQLPVTPHHPTDTALLDWLLTRLYRLGARGQSDLWAMTCFLAPHWEDANQGTPNLRIIVSRAMEAHRKLGQPPR